MRSIGSRSTAAQDLVGLVGDQQGVQGEPRREHRLDHRPEPIENLQHLRGGTRAHQAFQQQHLAHGAAGAGHPPGDVAGLAVSPLRFLPVPQQVLEIPRAQGRDRHVALQLEAGRVRRRQALGDRQALLVQGPRRLQVSGGDGAVGHLGQLVGQDALPPGVGGIR